MKDTVFYPLAGTFVTPAQAELLNRIPRTESTSVADFITAVASGIRPEFMPPTETLADLRTAGNPLYVSPSENRVANDAVAKALVGALERQNEADKVALRRAPDTDEAPVWYRRLVKALDILAEQYREDRSRFDHLMDEHGFPVEDYGYLMAEMLIEALRSLDHDDATPKVRCVCVKGRPATAGEAAGIRYRAGLTAVGIGSAHALKSEQPTARQAQGPTVKGTSDRDLAVSLREEFARSGGRTMSVVSAAGTVGSVENLSRLIQCVSAVRAGRIEPILGGVVFSAEPDRKHYLVIRMHVLD